jgi:hypothetical protein
MTAWQDQPPQSRRELRLSEQRGADGNNNAPSEDELAEQRARDAEADTANVARPEWASSPRRRSQHAYSQAQDGAERPSQIPSYGGPSFGSGAAGLPAQPAAPEERTPELQTPDARHPHRADGFDARAPRVDDTPPAYRVREFNPESRRSMYSATSELSASDWSKPGAAGEPVDLDYRTQQRPSLRPEPAQTPAVSVVPERPQPSSEHTLTRRELRAMREASERAAEQGAAAPAQPTAAPDPVTTPDPATTQTGPQQQEPQQQEPQGQELGRRPETQTAQVPPPLLTPPPLQAPAAPAPQSSQELSRAMAEFDTLISRDIPDAPAAVAAKRPSVFTPGPVHPTADDQSSNEQQDHEQQDHESQDADQPGNDQPRSDRPEDGQPNGRVIEEDPAADKVYTVPTGHWSTQGAIDDETQPGGVVLSRNVAAAGSPVTASHLVISSIPTANDLLLPFSATGEIMVTGTIDLPRSLGTTGAHPARYDHSDVDALLEASDREDSNVDSAPVRAIRAVSTHTSSRGLIGTVKPPRSSRLPMVLAISTAAVAAAVVVLFVAGFVLHLF